MTETRPPPPIDERDFDAIEAAVRETERGRWFLTEFARRNRLGETRLLLDAITRLEQNVGGPRPPEEADLVRAELAAMAVELGRIAAELADGEAQDVTASLDGFVRSAETVEAATADIHEAAERVSELAWQLREAGASARFCAELEKAAADISTACAFGGLTARRASALARAMRNVAARLDALPPGWVVVPRLEPVPVAPPPVPAADPGQPGDEGPRGEVPLSPPPAALPDPIPAAATPGPEPSAEREGRPSHPPLRMPVPSLQAIDALDFRERLKLFT